MRHERRTGYLYIVRVHLWGKKRRWAAVVPDTTYKNDIFIETREGWQAFRVFPNIFQEQLPSYGALQELIQNSTQAVRVSFSTENTLSGTQKFITQVSNVQILST